MIAISGCRARPRGTPETLRFGFRVFATTVTRSLQADDSASSRLYSFSRNEKIIF